MRRLAHTSEAFRDENIPIAAAVAEMAQMEPVPVPPELAAHTQACIEQHMADPHPLPEPPAVADPILHRKWVSILLLCAALLIIAFVTPRAWRASQKLLQAEWEALANAEGNAPSNTPSP